MASDDDVHSSDILDDVEIFVVAHVGKDDDHVAFLLVAKETGPLVHYFSVLSGLRDTARGLVSHHLGDVGKHADDADLHSSPADDGIRLHSPLAHIELAEVVVGADHWSLDGSYPAAKVLDAVVELVVAQGQTVIFEGVDERHLEVSVEDSIVWRSLVPVSGVQKQDLVLADGLAEAVDIGSALDNAAAANIFARTLRVEMTVSIVDVDDDEALRRGAGHNCQKAGYSKQKSPHG